MRKKKRLISLLLAVFIAVACLPAGIARADKASSIELKFDRNQIRKVCDIILSDKDRKLIVVSAPGKRCKEDTKVTDLLIALGEKYYKEGKADAELQAVIDRFDDIVKGLELSPILHKWLQMI